eukprot:symbB.v1.2.006183.t3/scaffold367.1/size382069/16
MLIFGQHCVKHNLIERLCFISKSKSDLASELPVAARLQLGGERGPLCTENTFLIMRKDPDLQLEVPNCRSAWQYFASDREADLPGCHLYSGSAASSNAPLRAQLHVLAVNVHHFFCCWWSVPCCARHHKYCLDIEPGHRSIRVPGPVQQHLVCNAYALRYWKGHGFLEHRGIISACRSPSGINASILRIFVVYASGS